MKAQKEKMKSMVPITPPKDLLKQVFGTSNENLLSHKHVRTHELKKDLSGDQLVNKIEKLFDYITPLSEPFKDHPTTNYLLPNFVKGTCGVSGIVNSVEQVPYNDMEMFSQIIGKIKHFSTECQLKEFM